MRMNGTVKVQGGKYKLTGAFHATAAQMPIRKEDEDRRLMGVTNPRALTHIHMYGGEAVFFENLSKGRISGTRCDNPDCAFAGTVFLPFRIHCPDCLSKNTVVDLTQTCRDSAIIHTFMVCERSGAFNTLQTPVKFINVEFEGVATVLMSYLSLGTPAIGQRVLPVFKTSKPSYTILDLSWVPLGTPQDMLPQGFSFA